VFRYGQDVVTPTVTWGDATFCGWYEQDATLPYVPGTMPAHDVEVWGAWTVPPVISLPVTVSSELSSGVAATVSAPALVHDTITVTWDTGAGAEVSPTGSIVVTGTMPDGHTWQVDSRTIPAGGAQPFVYSTTDQVLGTGATWEGGVLAQGVYQFRVEYVPDADAWFYAANSDSQQVTVVGWHDDFESYTPGTDMNGVGGWQEPYVEAGSPLLTVSTAYKLSGVKSLALTPESTTRARTVVHAFPEITSGVWEVAMWWYVPTAPADGIQTKFWLSAPGTGWSFLTSMGPNISGAGGYVPLVTEQWVPIRFVVDLDKHVQRMYYNNTYLGQVDHLPETLAFAIQPGAGYPTTYLDDVSVMPTAWPSL
jgi:hypothetical protein